jgi:putative ABC transport system ATP-binding protein
MSLLELDRVSKRFRRGAKTVLALDGVSLALGPGDSMAVWGGGNSGKTSLLRVAAGIDRPDSGSVRFDGRDLATVSGSERSKLLSSEIGCVWRSLRAPHGLSVLDQVALPLVRHGDARQARVRAREALVGAGVEDAASAAWHELEDGDRARVKLAHALVRDPRLLLADEPTANLNVVEREQLLGLFDKVTVERGIAVLMTAPDAPDTLRSHRLASLDRGQLIEPEREHGRVIGFPRSRRQVT